jgi:YgiT-type zinc finger domain-containing protein
MKCTICMLGETAPGTTTLTLERDGATIVIKQVPADVCDACGEGYMSESVTERVSAWAEEAVARGAEVAILRYIEA